MKLDNIYKACEEQAKVSKIRRNLQDFAFCKISYQLGATYQQVADYLGLATHSSAIYGCRRVDTLIDKQDEDFVPYFEAVKLRYKLNLQTDTSNLLDVVTNEIIDFILNEPEREKQFNHTKMMLIGIKGVGAMLEQRTNNVGTSLNQQSNKSQQIAKQ